MNTPLVSVIVATHNRPAGIRRLLGHLQAQTLDPNHFEVFVVDDASQEPVPVGLDGIAAPRNTWVLRNPERLGQGRARDRAARRARGDVLVIMDDDMQVDPGFLAAHLAHHQASTDPVVVLGNIQPDAQLDAMPLFERYHARQLARFQADAAAGTITMRGVHLCTGNVSLPRHTYLAVGGFDPSLQRSEDRELGVRLEIAGCRFVFGADAVTVHSSDHSDVTVWLRRAFLYGQYDLRIARKHETVPGTHPWRFWGLIHPVARPLLALPILLPGVLRGAARACYEVARAVAACGLGRAAVTLTAFAYAMEYFRAVRVEAGSLWQFRAEILTSRQRDGLSPRPPAKPALLAAIRADHAAVRRQRLKYHAEQIAPGRIGRDLVAKVGLQMLAWYRLMHWLDARRVPLVPMVLSRLVRHLYGAELHWRARLAPGISLVHGNGLVLSHGAEVAEGCILFQNVTLGESIDAVSGVIGAPRLERDVHVGPGATLLGPIVVGEGSKVMAGVVLTHSVPPFSLVAAPAPMVSPRGLAAVVPGRERRQAS